MRRSTCGYSVADKNNAQLDAQPPWSQVLSFQALLNTPKTGAKLSLLIYIQNMGLINQKLLLRHGCQLSMQSFDALPLFCTALPLLLQLLQTCIVCAHAFIPKLTLQSALHASQSGYLPSLACMWDKCSWQSTIMLACPVSHAAPISLRSRPAPPGWPHDWPGRPCTL